MTHGWTQERRKRQSQAIRRWKPWKKSTGPKTKEGKDTSSQNALKHGLRSADFRLMESLVAVYGKFERSIRHRD